MAVVPPTPARCSRSPVRASSPLGMQVQSPTRGGVRRPCSTEIATTSLPNLPPECIAEAKDLLLNGQAAIESWVRDDSVQVALHRQGVEASDFLASAARAIRDDKAVTELEFLTPSVEQRYAWQLIGQVAWEAALCRAAKEEEEARQAVEEVDRDVTGHHTTDIVASFGLPHDAAETSEGSPPTSLSPRAHRSKDDAQIGSVNRSVTPPRNSRARRRPQSAHEARRQAGLERATQMREASDRDRLHRWTEKSRTVLQVLESRQREINRVREKSRQRNQRADQKHAEIQALKERREQELFEAAQKELTRLNGQVHVRKAKKVDLADFVSAATLERLAVLENNRRRLEMEKEEKLRQSEEKARQAQIDADLRRQRQLSAKRAGPPQLRAAREVARRQAARVERIREAEREALRNRLEEKMEQAESAQVERAVMHSSMAMAMPVAPPGSRGHSRPTSANRGRLHRPVQQLPVQEPPAVPLMVGQEVHSTGNASGPFRVPEPQVVPCPTFAATLLSAETGCPVLEFSEHLKDADQSEHLPLSFAKFTEPLEESCETRLTDAELNTTVGQPHSKEVQVAHIKKESLQSLEVLMTEESKDPNGCEAIPTQAAVETSCGSFAMQPATHDTLPASTALVPANVASENTLAQQVLHEHARQATSEEMSAKAAAEGSSESLNMKPAVPDTLEKGSEQEPVCETMRKTGTEGVSSEASNLKPMVPQLPSMSSEQIATIQEASGQNGSEALISCSHAHAAKEAIPEVSNTKEVPDGNEKIGTTAAPASLIATPPPPPPLPSSAVRQQISKSPPDIVASSPTFGQACSVASTSSPDASTNETAPLASRPTAPAAAGRGPPLAVNAAPLPSCHTRSGPEIRSWARQHVREYVEMNAGEDAGGLVGRGGIFPRKGFREVSDQRAPSHARGLAISKAFAKSSKSFDEVLAWAAESPAPMDEFDNEHDLCATEQVVTGAAAPCASSHVTSPTKISIDATANTLTEKSMKTPTSAVPGALSTAVASTQHVQYLSRTHGGWTPAKIVATDFVTGAIQIDRKPKVWLTPEEQQHVIRFPPSDGFPQDMTQGKVEEEVAARADEESRAKVEESKTKVEDEVKSRSEEVARSKCKAEEEARAKAEEDAKTKFAEEARTRAREEAWARDIAAEAVKAEAERQARMEVETRTRVTEEMAAKAAENAQVMAKRKAEEEEQQHVIRLPPHDASPPSTLIPGVFAETSRDQEGSSAENIDVQKFAPDPRDTTHHPEYPSATELEGGSHDAESSSSQAGAPAITKKEEEAAIAEEGRPQAEEEAWARSQDMANMKAEEEAEQAESEEDKRAVAEELSPRLASKGKESTPAFISAEDEATAKAEDLLKHGAEIRKGRHVAATDNDADDQVESENDERAIDKTLGQSQFGTSGKEEDEVQQGVTETDAEKSENESASATASYELRQLFETKGSKVEQAIVSSIDELEQVEAAALHMNKAEAGAQEPSAEAEELRENAINEASANAAAELSAKIIQQAKFNVIEGARRNEDKAAEQISTTFVEKARSNIIEEVWITSEEEARAIEAEEGWFKASNQPRDEAMEEATSKAQSWICDRQAAPNEVAQKLDGDRSVAAPWPALEAAMEIVQRTDANVDFIVTWDRKEDEALGLELKRQRGGKQLVIGEALGSAVERWNSINPGLEIMRCDEIVMVNGVTGNADTLIDAMQRARQKLVVRLRRDLRVRISVEKTADLGIKFLADSAMVSNVLGGMIHEWNLKAESSQVIGPGDMLIEVNGMTGTAAELVQTVDHTRRGEVLHLCFARPGCSRKPPLPPVRPPRGEVEANRKIVPRAPDKVRTKVRSHSATLARDAMEAVGAAARRWFSK